MSLKRKRSSPSLSPTSSPSTPPTLQHFFPASKPIQPSRTMKRYRDSRPSESVIHASTLHKLFSAQTKALPEIDMAIEVEEGLQEEEETMEMEIELPTQSCTLLQFWGRPTGHDRHPSEGGGDMDLDIGLGIDDVMQCT